MSKKATAIARATAVIGATTAMVVGVTMAQLGANTVTLANNTISTTTASLAISTGAGFATTAQGFRIDDLVPGRGTEPQQFSLRNSGGVDLNITAQVPNAPTVTGFSGLENVKVTITNTNSTNANSDASVETDLQALVDGNVALPGDPLEAGADGNFTITFDIDSEAVTGSFASVAAFDIVLTGTQPTNTGTGSGDSTTGDSTTGDTDNGGSTTGD
ncbi:MAG TPA: hypothetical protein VK963_01350, partial [Candidatus Saccharimonadales bacterium]|nr:hypothetical protein [Candidatus Saccharimonadales bacterium]